MTYTKHSIRLYASIEQMVSYYTTLEEGGVTLSSAITEMPLTKTATYNCCRAVQWVVLDSSQEREYVALVECKAVKQ